MPPQWSSARPTAPGTCRRRSRSRAGTRPRTVTSRSPRCCRSRLLISPVLPAPRLSPCRHGAATNHTTRAVPPRRRSRMYRCRARQAHPGGGRNGGLVLPTEVTGSLGGLSLRLRSRVQGRRTRSPYRAPPEHSPRTLLSTGTRIRMPLNPRASSATPAAPGLPVLSTTVATPATSGEPAGATARTDAAGGDSVLSTLAPARNGSGPSTVANVAQLPHTFGARSISDDASHGQPPTDVPGGGDAEARGLADRGPAPDSAVFRSGPVRLQVNGATPDAASSALSGATTGTAVTSAVPGEGVLELAEFPVGGGGTTGVDIGDLAASISRPLAGGNGDYSVQVMSASPRAR